MPKVHLTPESITTICSQYALNGQNLLSVGQSFGLSAKIVRRVLVENGVSIKPSSVASTVFYLDGAQTSEILDRYTNRRETQEEIARNMDIRSWQIAKVLTDHSVERMSRNEYTSTYTDNDGFFSVIDTHEKAYVLGFICADGFVHESLNRLEIRLSSKDREHLVRLRDILAPQRPVHDKVSILNGKAHDMALLAIVNRQMVNDLVALDVRQRKSLTMGWPRNLPEEFAPSFILGYFDGDGCITSNPAGDYRLEMLGTPAFLQCVADRLNTMIRRPLVVRSKAKTKIHIIQIGGNWQIMDILDWLYSKSPIRLERKHARYQTLKTRYQGKTNRQTH